MTAFRDNVQDLSRAVQRTRECVRGDRIRALVVDEKVYTLRGDKSEIDKSAREKTNAIGTAEKGTITVESIAAPKK